MQLVGDHSWAAGAEAPTAGGDVIDRSRRHLRLIAALTFAAALLAGCGSSSKSAGRTSTAVTTHASSSAAVASTGASSSTAGSSTTTAALAPTKAQFIAEADAICSGAAGELSRLTPKIEANATTAAQIEQKAKPLSEAAAIHAQELAKLEALAEPTGEAATLSAIWSSHSQIIALLRRTASAIGRLDLTALAQDETASARIGSVLEQRAKAFGLSPSCS